MLQTKTFTRTEGIDLQPLDDYSSAFVFRVSPPSALLLDPHSWLVLELCEGQSFEELEKTYLSTIQTSTRSSHTRLRLVEALEMLEQRGLLVLNVSS